MQCKFRNHFNVVLSNPFVNFQYLSFHTPLYHRLCVRHIGISQRHSRTCAPTAKKNEALNVSLYGSMGDFISHFHRNDIMMESINHLVICNLQVGGFLRATDCAVAVAIPFDNSQFLTPLPIASPFKFHSAAKSHGFILAAILIDKNLHIKLLFFMGIFHLYSISTD